MFRIPLPELPGSMIADAIGSAIRNRNERQRMAQEGKYRQQQMDVAKQQLGFQREKFEHEKEMYPLEKMYKEAQTKELQSKNAQNEYMNTIMNKYQEHLKNPGSSTVDDDTGMDIVATLKGHPPSVSVHGGYQWIYNPMTGKTRKGEKVEQTPEEIQQQKSNQPVSPYGKAVADLNYLAKTYGKESTEYKDGQAYLKRIVEGTPGLEIVTDPKTGFTTITQGRKAPQSQVVDGQLIQKPSATTINQVQGQQLANRKRLAALPYLDHPYLGEGSNQAILTDLNNIRSGTLSGNEKIETENRLVKAALAEKMAPEIAMFQLQSQNAKTTVPAIKAQTKSLKMGWPASLNFSVNNLPQYLQERVNNEHSDVLKKLTKESEQYYARGLPIEAPSSSKQSTGASQATSSPVAQPTGNKPKYTQAQLDKWAAQAFARGAKKEDINREMEKLKKETI